MMVLAMLATLLLTVTADIKVAYVPLTGSNDCDYNAPIVIDGQTYFVIIDSGSSNIAVATAECSSCGVYPLYNGPLTDIPCEVEYGIGGFNGSMIASLNFTIGGLPVTMPAMGITSQVEFFSCGNQTQGILGMAYANLSAGNPGQFPVMMDVLETTGVPNGFALQLCASMPEATNSPKTGNMWIGGYDSSFTSGPMEYVSVVQELYYNIQLNGVTVGGKSLPFNYSLNEPTAIIDSGTTQIIINNFTSYWIILTAIQAGDFITFVDSLTEEEIASFWIGNSTLTSDQYTLKNQDNWEMSFLILNPQGGNTSVSVSFDDIFQAAYGELFFTMTYDPDGELGTVIGEAVFTGNVVFFDRGGQRIGFAKGINCFGPASADGIDHYASYNATYTATPTPTPTSTPTSTNSPSPSHSHSGSSINQGSVLALLFAVLLVFLAL